MTNGLWGFQDRRASGGVKDMGSSPTLTNRMALSFGAFPFSAKRNDWTDFRSSKILEHKINLGHLSNFPACLSSGLEVSQSRVDQSPPPRRLFLGVFTRVGGDEQGKNLVYLFLSFLNRR